MIFKKLITLSLISAFSQTSFADTLVSPTESIDTFEKLFGVTDGKRRNHTKGFCFSATLTPKSKDIQNYSTSKLFTQSSNVIGRFSHKGGNNLAPDDKPGDYGMGLSIQINDNGNHLMSLNTLDFFPVSTPEAFAELMRAKVTGSKAVKAFKQKNTDLQRFKAHHSKKTKILIPYEGHTFNSINSFYLVNDKAIKTAIRWSFVPQAEQKLVIKPSQEFLFENLQQKLTSTKISWDMIITLANPEDAINNAAIPWQGKHKQIIAAELTINKIQTENEGKCDLINYDPMVLSAGFEPSADPLLQARRNAYAVGFGRRSSEK